MRRLVLLLSLLLITPAHALAQFFSVDPASPAIDGNITPDDVLVPGPSVFIHGTSLGQQDDFFDRFFDNLDALSNGLDPIVKPLYFSVDRVSVGQKKSAVFKKAHSGVGSAAGDIYRALPPFGSNSLYIPEVQSGLKPGFFGDDLDALDFDLRLSDPKYFSIDAMSASIDASIRPGNIFLNDINNIFASYSSMGLDFDDDIDALVLDVKDGIALFSLSPFSPNTFTASGLKYVPGAEKHLSPADILITTFNGNFTLYASANDMGLRPGDNVDALETTLEITVPEPSGLVLLTIGAIAGGGVSYCRTWTRARRSENPVPPAGNWDSEQPNEDSPWSIPVGNLTS